MNQKINETLCDAALRIDKVIYLGGCLVDTAIEKGLKWAESKREIEKGKR